MAGFKERGRRSIRSVIRTNWPLRALRFLEKRQNVISLLRSLGILAAVAIVFYSSIWAFVLLLPFAVPLTRRFQRQQEERERVRLMAEFRELLTSLVTSLKAGYAAENAFREAYREMVFLYGDGSRICTELTRILRGLDNHRTIDELLHEFASRACIDEITEFADVFAIAGRQGGNLTEIMERTDGLIRDRMEVESEIRILLASRRYEQTVMDLVPFGIIVYIGITSPGFFDAMYHNVLGILVMTVCLAVYVAAIRISEQIMNIQV